MPERTVTLKEAVQVRLGVQLASDPGLRERLQSDPDSVIKPILAELLGDDGEIDLSAVSTKAHIESPNELHFVVAPDALELDEVSGFQDVGLSVSGFIGSYDIDVADIGGDTEFFKKRTNGGRCTNDGHRGTKCCYL